MMEVAEVPDGTAEMRAIWLAAGELAGKWLVRYQEDIAKYM